MNKKKVSNKTYKNFSNLKLFILKAFKQNNFPDYPIKMFYANRS